MSVQFQILNFGPVPSAQLGQNCPPRVLLSAAHGPSRQNTIHHHYHRQHSYPTHSLRHCSIFTPFIIFFFISLTLSQTSLQTLTELLLPQKYTYPDPTPEFAEAETHEFRDEILKKLSKDKETFGDERDTVNEVFNNFLHKEYGGPGTLLVEPFTDMLIAPKERKLPAGP